MIPLIEDLLTETIENRLKWLKSNVDIVDRIFSQASVTSRNRLKTYLGKNGINVMRGFPIDRTTMPAYVIMLGGETEMGQSLGGYLGDDDEGYELMQTTENQRIINHDGVFAVRVDHKPIFSVNSITYNGVYYDFEWDVIDENKGLIALDFPVDLTESDTVTIDYVYKEKGLESYGTFYNSQYRIETWTTNGDLTVLLYHLLKWIMLSSRDYLGEQGLVVQNLGGLDFEPAPEYMPEFVFRRALTFECTTENSYDAEFSYIQDIEIKGVIADGEETN